MISRAQRRAEYALTVIKGVRADEAADFAAWTQSFPASLRTNGLGQSLAYLRGQSAEHPGAKRLADAIWRWLTMPEGEDDAPVLRSVDDDIFATLKVGGPAEARARYVFATEAVWELCEWLKPLAAAHLPQAADRRAR